jgi:GTP:adenosylcobinamide-phosphate guanylyltransferase
MIAAIMCGGKGTRMQGFATIEKPLLKLNGRTMIELVLNALIQSEKFRRIVAVTSYEAPKTKSFVAANFSHNVDVLKTDGKGFSEDVSIALNTLKPARVFMLSADLPLLESKHVKKVVSQYRRQDVCTSVVCAKDFVISLGIKPSITLCINSTEYCLTGISMIDSTKIHSAVSLPERYIIMNQTGVAVNVNTRSDLQAAERLMMCHY